MKLADQIKLRLMNWVRSHSYDLVLPNYFVGRYEMDLFVLKQSGVLVEYEIKISRSDFFNDFNKGSKHKDMADKNCFANKFYFVVPTGLVKESEIPEYSGLIYYDNGSLQLIKVAPSIHKKKYISNALLHKLAFRCNNLTGKLNMSEYKRKEAEKRVQKLKEEIKKIDPKNIQIFF